MIIHNARVLTFDSTNRVLDSGAVEILPDGSIGQIEDSVVGRTGTARRTLMVRGRAKNEEGTANHSPLIHGRDSNAEGTASRTPTTPPDHEILDAQGKLLMPALINCHTHLYSTLARGISLPGRAPRNFPEILKKLWWRLDRALNLDDVYYSALVGLIDSAKCGVGTLVDHHSSPNACAGSLDRIEQAFREVGLRGVLCYETSDRNGAQARRRASLRTSVFLNATAGARATAWWPAALDCTLPLRSVTAPCGALWRRMSLCARVSMSMWRRTAAMWMTPAGATTSRRSSGCVDRGILDDRSLAAHCVHVSAADIAALARRQINVVHNPQSNCNNAVGIARLLEMFRQGVLVGLGSDGYTPRMWEEFKAAFHVQKVRERDPRVAYAEAYAAALLNNRTIARKIWGWEIGRIESGARADLLLVDYFPPTPLDSSNLFGHFLFGIANAPVDSLLVNGRFVLRNKECVTVDEREVAAKAAVRARALWRRF